MTLSYVETGILVTNRLQLPASQRLPVQKIIPSALQRLADEVSMDTRKRGFLLTDRATVTTTPSGAGAVDLQTLITSSAIMLDKIRLGFIFNTTDLKPLDYLSNNQFAGVTLVFANTAASKFYRIVGKILYALKGDGTAITTALQFQIPFIPTLAQVPSSLEDDLLDLVTEMYQSGGQEGGETREDANT